MGGTKAGLDYRSGSQLPKAREEANLDNSGGGGYNDHIDTWLEEEIWDGHEERQNKNRNPDTIAPSSPYDINAKPKGSEAKITKHLDEESTRSLRRENEAAQILAQHGYNIEQNPKVEGTTRKPDYVIEGKIFDCYAPAKNTSVRSIGSTISGKVVEKKQADRIILNLDDWTGDINALKKQLSEHPIVGLKEVLAVRNGEVIPIYPQEV